jgi:hypothetical protein
MTTNTNQNPSFRVYEMDKRTMLPVKASTYYFDISQPNPEWKLYMEYTERYGMKDLSPSSFEDLNKRIRSDGKVAQDLLMN